MSNTKMTDKQKVTTMADSDYVFGNFGGKVGQMSIPDFRSHLYDDSPGDESPELSALKSRISAVEDKNTEQDTRIASLLQDIPWEGYHMNAFTDTGEYHIHGERTDANDGLPILNAASGHTIDARLTVLDSSLTGGTGKNTDTVVTQILRLSNRTGGDGHVYVRTGQAATKAELTAADSTKWSTWEKLMGMFEKNVVSDPMDLDGYTTNGMYSGILMPNSAYVSHSGLGIFPASTFLIVTVNGYAVASAGLTPQLTQMLYIMPPKNVNVVAKMYLRTAYWDATGKAWVYGDWDKIATANDLSPITADVQSAKTLANNNAGRISDVEGRVSGTEGRISAIENIIPEEGKFSAIVELGKYQSFAAMFAEAAKFERVTNDGLSVMHGTYVLSGDVCNSVLILQQVHKNTDGSGTAMQHIYIEKRRFTRYINFSATAVTAVQGVQNDGARNLFFNTTTGKLLMRDMWSNNIGEAATLPNNGSLREGTPTLSTVPLVLTKTFGDTVTATLMPATSARAGVMTAADKTKVGNYPEQFVLDLGILNNQSEGENIAAASEVAGNRNISFIRFQVQGVSELKTTLIMQWPNGINVTAQIMCVDKAQWRRNVTGATGVKGATTNAFKWERTAPHSIDYDEQRRMIQLKDYENQTVSQEVELPLATSSQHGLMSIADKEKISAMESKLSALEARVAALGAR